MPVHCKLINYYTLCWYARFIQSQRVKILFCIRRYVLEGISTYNVVVLSTLSSTTSSRQRILPWPVQHNDYISRPHYLYSEIRRFLCAQSPAVLRLDREIELTTFNIVCAVSVRYLARLFLRYFKIVNNLNNVTFICI